MKSNEPATLDIVIPSFNRYDALIRTIQRLDKIASKTSGIHVSVQVLDNCSEDKRYTSLNNIGNSLKSLDFLAVRRDKNYGIYRNIRDAFHHGLGDWLWVLSDDDELSFENFDFLTNCGGFDLVALRANVKGFPTSENQKALPEAREILKELPMYSVLGFISVIIYSRNLVKKMDAPLLEQQDGYEWTLFPHVKLLLEALSSYPSTTALALADREYVKWTPGKASYQSQKLDAISGMYSLLCLAPAFRRELLDNMARNFSYSHFLKPVFRDHRILYWSYRAFGLLGVLRLFGSGLFNSVGIASDKVRRLNNRS